MYGPDKLSQIAYTTTPFPDTSYFIQCGLALYDAAKISCLATTVSWTVWLKKVTFVHSTKILKAHRNEKCATTF